MFFFLIYIYYFYSFSSPTLPSLTHYLLFLLTSFFSVSNFTFTSRGSVSFLSFSLWQFPLSIFLCRFLFRPSNYFCNRQIFWIFILYSLFNTASSAPLPLCRRMLGSKQGLLRLWHWQSGAVSTQIVLINWPTVILVTDLSHSPYLHFHNFLCSFLRSILHTIPHLSLSNRFTVMYCNA